MAFERRSSSVTALFASFVATLPIPVSLAIGSDRFKYFNSAIASSAENTRSCIVRTVGVVYFSQSIALIMRHKYDSHNMHK